MLKVFAIPSDSEGPLYPSNEFKSRLWTIKKNFEAVLDGKIQQNTKHRTQNVVQKNLL